MSNFERIYALLNTNSKGQHCPGSFDDEPTMLSWLHDYKVQASAAMEAGGFVGPGLSFDAVYADRFLGIAILSWTEESAEYHLRLCLNRNANPLIGRL